MASEQDAFLYEHAFLGGSKSADRPSIKSSKQKLTSTSSSALYRTPKADNKDTSEASAEVMECETNVSKESSLDELKAKFSKVKKLIKQGLVDKVESSLKELSRENVVVGSEKKQKKMLKSLKKKLVQGVINSDRIEKYYKVCHSRYLG